MSEVAGSLDPLLHFCHLRCRAAPAKAVLERDAEALVPVTLAELMDHEVGMGAVGKEAQPVAVAARFENIVDVQGDRRVRSTGGIRRTRSNMRRR